jgi:hypothetical protein
MALVTMLNAWLSFGLKAWQIGLEAQSVIALRMLRLAAGGARAEAEGTGYKRQEDHGYCQTPHPASAGPPYSTFKRAAPHSLLSDCPPSAWRAETRAVGGSMTPSFMGHFCFRSR